MNIVPYDRIVVVDRQRKKINTPELNELKESILQRGLLNAPVVRVMDDGSYRMIAGERRYRALGLIHKEGRSFLYNGEEMLPPQVPVTFLKVETLLQEKEAELDENIQRVDLTWQEKAEALADIHKEKQVSNPKQTFRATAQDVVAKTGGSADAVRTKIREAVVIAEHLNDPAIANARSAAEAHTLILKKEEEKIFAEVARRRIAKMGTVPDIVITQGDCIEIMKAMDPDQVDLTLNDPPYGLGANKGGFRERTVHHHNYEDDEEGAWKIQNAILVECFRISKPRANIFMFNDIKWFERWKRVAAQIGWTPFPRPMIWGKSDSEGLAPWGAQGPRITTEFIFFATKGQKGMIASPTDYLRHNRVPRNERIHAAQKPLSLLEELITCTTLPGDMVFDPCCGSGSTLVAAKKLKRRGRGIEKDPNYYATAMANVYGGDSLPDSSPTLRGGGDSSG